MSDGLSAVCDCGEVVHAVANEALDDWTWVDAQGRVVVDRSPEGYADDPRGWWARLAAENIAAYSDLSAREGLGMLGWTHVHRPAVMEPFEGDVPRCCGMPMRFAPSGWRCRETKH